jgi:hypothetical protein
MDVRYLLLLFLFISCLPESQIGKTNLSSSSTANDENNSASSASIPDSPTQWNYLGQNKNSIIINGSNLNNSYITGSLVEKFLGITNNGAFSNLENQNYCLIARYNVSGLIKELRTRIVPISYYDFTAKRHVRIFRVDFNDIDNSANFCIGNGLIPNQLYIMDATYNLTPDPATVSSITHRPELICPTCTTNISSQTVKIFRYVKNSTMSVQLNEINPTQVNISSLSLSIDPNNAAISSSGTCSNSSCKNLGYSCCLENQCVMEGQTRPSASTLYPNQLASANLERIQNLSSYLNYPHLYYVCGTSTQTSGSTTTTPTPLHNFNQLKAEYDCIQYLKSKSTSGSFHEDLKDSFWAPSAPVPPATTTCNLTSSSNTMYFRNVVKSLYTKCGCKLETLNEMLNTCPAYDYTVTAKDSSGNPLALDCYTPPVTVQGIPTQQTINVNSKSAPHRFFRACGLEHGASGSCTNSQQEGDTFNYLDEENLIPSQTNFGMNSILGQMNVSLDKTIPAKVVIVENDKLYQISTISGIYSPCPTCSKDSWFSSFSAFPPTNYGTGLQAIGHTTTRDTYSTNITLGNYEDTIFGRACWIPPTMIPFTHSTYGDVQTQRLNRLEGQAAMFINGYQRDWFGFNKGALIGSFDGVTWFAVGKGRIVKSSSTKLFLAINAPFADLASPTLHSVNIQLFDGMSLSAETDYDPQYHLSHSYQNEAGNCQANHLCSTDTDCITKLGWEYMCADVAELKTNLPLFDVTANEKTGSQVVTIDQILQQKKFTGTSTKRCVYRGSGSICYKNTSSLTDLNQRKLFTCAPNFYCNSLGSTGFNAKVSRFGSNLEDIPLSRNHLFGKDANVLGRPLDYLPVTGTNLTVPVISNIEANIKNNISVANGSTSGLCLPGKELPNPTNQATLWNPYVQQQNKDSNLRTDFINQIASCNSSLYTDYRYSSCPVIGDDGNYEMFSTNFSASNYHLKARMQNSCGNDTLKNSSTVTPNAYQSSDVTAQDSPFKTFEAKQLHLQTNIQPTLVRDACLRRAGEVCHSDLDCSPNNFHADSTDFNTANWFGNEAERKFYSELLICGQAEAKPSLNDGDQFKNYKMNLNRCCREAGKDLTTYSSDIPTDGSGSTYDPSSVNLRPWIAPGLQPASSNRYSRFAGLGVQVPSLTQPDPTYPPLNAFMMKSGSLLGKKSSTGAISYMPSPAGMNIKTPNQWKTLGAANSKSCCGGGWIRKFSDGSTNWNNSNRLQFDVSNFKCLNYRTPLMTSPNDITSAYLPNFNINSLLAADYNDYCVDAPSTSVATGNCAMYNFTSTQAEDPPTSVAGPNAIYFDTGNVDFVSRPNNYFKVRSADENTDTFMDYSSTSGRRNLVLKVPSYFDKTFDSKINVAGASFRLYDMASSSDYITCTYLSTPLSFSGPTSQGSCSSGSCCYTYETASRVIKVTFNSAPPSSSPNLSNKKVAFRLDITSGPQLLPAHYNAGKVSSDPGSNTFYLKRLGLLELSGIPQITFKPLYCNDDMDKLVPGIFKSTISTRSQFQSIGFIHDSEYQTNKHNLAIEPVFAENDFKCCTPLGKITDNVSKCCSGAGSMVGNKYSCELPNGTNLMVYFNRFVSNEGRDKEGPGGGLEDADFDPQTGEPLLSNAVIQKIAALGNNYCTGRKVRIGGAFGEFALEPIGPRTIMGRMLYNIVDSARDYGSVSTAGSTNETGYVPFMEGFRWNHHLYCSE